MCALHEQKHTLIQAIIKFQKYKYILCEQRIACSFKFPEGASPNHAGVTTRSVASRKVALGDQYTKGSETAKVGTDEQKRHKRHREKGEYAHK